MDDWGTRRTVRLADELRLWRQRRGLSYRALAKRVTCEHSHLWKIEHGKAALTRVMAEACDRALDAGGAIIAAWVAAQGSVRPAQLPVAPARLVGRDAELAALRSATGARPPGTPVVVAVDGPAGIGKTALALRWAHQVADEYVDGHLYADLAGFGSLDEPVTVGVVLERFLTSMGVSPVPDTEQERASLYRSLLAERKVLVVLDNVGDVSDVEQLLPASAGCTVVVTSRRALAGLIAHVGAARVTVKPLVEPDSVRLVSQIIGNARADADPSAVARLARLCGHLPIALRVAAEHIATYPRRAVADLVDELVEAHDRSGALELIDLRAVFSGSYERVGRDAARLFRLIGLHRGTHLSVPAIAALADVTPAQARRLLHRLASVHLVDVESDSMVRLHGLIHAYARELATGEEGAGERVAAARRLVRWYMSAIRGASVHLAPKAAATAAPPLLEGATPMVFANEADARTWRDAEQANLQAVVTMAIEYGPPGAAHQLSIASRLVESDGDMDEPQDLSA